MLEEEQIDKLEQLEGREFEEYLLKTIEEVFLYIIDIHEENEDKKAEKNQIVKDTARKIKEMDFRYKKKITKLSKTINVGEKKRMNVYRCLNIDVSEGWYAEITSSKYDKPIKEWLCKIPSYVNRIDQFKKSKIEDNKVVFYDRLDQKVASIDIPE